MERRIVQIFDRKKSIIDQAKHQADLFDQLLASQLLVSGIYPPTWLWTPLFQSQNFDCAGGFPQYPEFAIPSYNSLENKISEAEYNAEHVEFPVQSESLEARSSTLLPLPDSGPRCSFHGPNLDSSPIHLQDKEDAISDNVQDPAMSLARLQRSKSRQRAIELRNSAKSASRLLEEKNDSVFDGRVSGTAITSLRSNHVREVEVVRPSDTKDSQERNGIKECDHMEEGPVTRPRLSCRKNSSFDVNTSSSISDKDEKAHADDTGKLRQQSAHASGKLELFSCCSGPIGTDSAIICKQKKETRSRQIKERRTDSYSGRITRSMTYRQNYPNASSLSMPYSSFNTVDDDGSRVRPTSCNSSFPQLPSWSGDNTDSNISQVSQLPGTSSACHKSAELQNRNGCALLVVGNLVDGCAAGSIGPLEHAGEQSGVKSLLATEDIVEPVNSSSIIGHGVTESHSSSFRKIMPIQLLNKFQEGIQEHTSTSNTVDGPMQAENIAGTEIGTYGSLNQPCAPSTSNLDSTGLAFGREVILSRMSSDCSVSDLSQHNEFNDDLESDSNKICSLLPRDEIDNISSGALDFMRVVRGQNKCNSASYMTLLKKKDIFTIEGKLEGASMLIQKSPEISALQPNLSRDFIIDSPAAALEVEKIVISEQQKVKSGVPELQAADTQSELADESVEAAAEGSDSTLSMQQHMQKKIDDQLKNPVSVTTTPDVEKDLQFITRDFIVGKNEEDYMKSVHFLPLSKAHVTLVNDFNSCSEGMDKNNNRYTIEGSESSPELQVEKDGAILEVQDNVKTSITDLSISPSFGLVTNSGGVSLCLEAKGVMNPICRVFDAGKQHVIQENQESLQINEGLSLGDSEHFTCVGNIQGKTNHLEGKLQFSNSSVGPLHTQSSDDNYVDETMPIFESFLVQSDDKRVVKEEINFEKLNLSSSTMERVGSLEQLCKSACVYTPLSSSNTYKLHTLMNYVQSVSGGVLENGGILEKMDVESSDSINETMKLLKESKIYNENAIISSNGSSYSDCPLNSNDQFASNLRNYYVSPVGKLWNRITSDSIISEKSGSLNSELPCIREENENEDGVTDTLTAAIAEDQATQSIQRVPLANINEMAFPTILVSEAKICDDKYSQYSVDIDNSINRLQQPMKKKHCNERNSRVTYYGNIKENYSATPGGNGAKSRFTRTKLLGDTGLNKEGEIFSEKETKPSNVVSNITSFIPLVQKKQAAAVVKGKRDVKVKALDAAEAAKRLAEKKENERKMKKEAMKLERERMEQENLKQLEMQRKKKEEEQKKKEADIALKKRQREEEERKDKERKRLRTEEMRKRQREYNEKSVAEKGMGCKPKDRKARSEKEGKNDIKIVEKDQRIDRLQEMSEAERRTDAASTIDTGKSNTIHVDCGPLQENCNEIEGLSDIDHSTKNLDFDTNQHSSYEISPFKCSDDEEEDDDDNGDEDMPNSKFIPSWASKNSLARAVASQSTVNPEIIFHLKSFCNIVEVVLPRKVSAKIASTEQSK